MQRVLFPVHGRVAPARAGARTPGPGPAFARPLDEQLHLLTAHDLTMADVPGPGRKPAPGRSDSGEAIVRLAHVLPAEEGGAPVKVDLAAVFTELQVEAVAEQLLGANGGAEPSRAGNLPFRTANPVGPAPFPPVRGAVTDTAVVVAPMEIRTWVVRYRRS